eukprot:7386631-Prymnesium_polylepis.2
MRQKCPALSMMRAASCRTGRYRADARRRAEVRAGGPRGARAHRGAQQARGLRLLDEVYADRRGQGRRRQDKRRRQGARREGARLVLSHIRQLSFLWSRVP